MSGGVAFYDVDGTIVDATIVHYYVFLAVEGKGPVAALLWKLGFLPRIPWYWLLDQFSRERFNRSFYHNYRGFGEKQLEEAAERLYSGCMAPRLFPQAVASIEAHRSRDEAVVLVSGSLRPLLGPLSRELGADDVLAAEPEVRDGRYTGELVGVPLAGSHKAAAVRRYLESRGINAAECCAYADSADDAGLLGSVGRGNAVNPGRSLRRLASERGWEVLNWKRSAI